MDLILRSARLRGRGGVCDIGVTNGKITKIAEKIREKAANEIDAEGKLTTPAFVNCHIHLDKTDTGKWANVTWENVESIIEADSKLKKESTHEDMKQRAGRVIDLAATYGTTILRGFADVDTLVELKDVKAILEVKRDYRDLMDIQVCAFAQEGFTRNPGTYDLMCKAMELGADVVGGIPWLERSYEESFNAIDCIFEIAKKYGKDVHFLDNTLDPNSRTIEYIALKAIKENYHGRAVISSAWVLSLYNRYYAQKVIKLLKQAQVSCSTNEPDTMIHARDWPQPRIRAITMVNELLKAGVNVSCGQDDVNDTYYPLGKNDMLENALVLAHTAQLDTVEGIESLYDMITWRGAKSLRISDYGLEEGKRADLVVLDAPTVHHALRMQSERLYVIKGGKVVAENRVTRKLHK